MGWLLVAAGGIFAIFGLIVAFLAGFYVGATHGRLIERPATDTHRCYDRGFGEYYEVQKEKPRA
jgi:hypothetical protein